jgi:hypothetical protein
MPDDIVVRLRRWTHDVHATPASELMDEAANELDRVRVILRDVQKLRDEYRDRCGRYIGTLEALEEQVGDLEAVIRAHKAVRLKDE